jgi:uncharacterized membrane-anchored protein
MKKYKWIIIIANLIFLLAFFNASIIKKERLLKDGKLVLLKLAPRDPRSMMQGDYMQLNYVISRISDDDILKRGFCVVKINDKNIAEKVRLQDKRTPLNDGELLIEYNKARWQRINIGAESFFFEEGQGKKYEKAKYGALKIDDKGHSLLIGLYDENLHQIE